jgi:hypothetical protein
LPVDQRLAPETSMADGGDFFSSCSVQKAAAVPLNSAKSARQT